MGRGGGVAGGRGGVTMFVNNLGARDHPRGATTCCLLFKSCLISYLYRGFMIKYDMTEGDEKS